MGFPGGSEGKKSASNTGDLGSIPGFHPWVQGDPPEKEMATQSRILATGTAHSVNLVDEDDAGGFLLRLTEEVADAAEATVQGLQSQT